jgi:hypothetical protein
MKSFIAAIAIVLWNLFGFAEMRIGGVETPRSIARVLSSWSEAALLDAGDNHGVRNPGFSRNP